MKIHRTLYNAACRFAEAQGHDNTMAAAVELETEAERFARSKLFQWLDTEIIDDEGAMINAQEQGEWDRYHRLEGHKMALLHVKNHLIAT